MGISIPIYYGQKIIENLNKISWSTNTLFWQRFGFIEPSSKSVKYVQIDMNELWKFTLCVVPKGNNLGTLFKFKIFQKMGGEKKYPPKNYFGKFTAGCLELFFWFYM